MTETETKEETTETKEETAEEKEEKNPTTVAGTRRICYGYLRNHDSAGKSWEKKQRNQIEDWVSSNKWNLVRLYVEGNAGHLEEMARAVNDFKNMGEGPTRLVVAHPEVLSDVGMNQAWIDKVVSDLGGKVHYLSGEIDSDDEHQLQVLTGFQSKFRVSQMNVARVRRRELGESSIKPYGESEVEREILGKVLSWKNLGFNLQEISDRLNEEDLRTRRGKAWTPGNLRHILKGKI